MSWPSAYTGKDIVKINEYNIHQLTCPLSMISINSDLVQELCQLVIFCTHPKYWIGELGYQNKTYNNFNMALYNQNHQALVGEVGGLLFPWDKKYLRRSKMFPLGLWTIYQHYIMGNGM